MRVSQLRKLLWTSLFSTLASAVFAGAVVHVETLVPLDPTDSSDDTIVTQPLQWSEDDFPVPLYVYSPFGGMGDFSILPRAVNTNEVRDQDIMSGLQRVISGWNDASLSKFEFSTAPYLSTQAPIYDPIQLPFGPQDVRLDRYNLITFQDPDIIPGDGVLYIPHVFYFGRDFDPTEDGLNAADLYMTELETGDIGLDLNRDSIIDVSLPWREYHAGEVIDSDISMNGAEPLWFQYPEDEDDLAQMDPPLSPEDTLGTLDIESAFARGVGEMVGLGTSHLYNATMREFYIVPEDDNDIFLVNPYEMRDLDLDDELTIAQNYPDGYFGAPGFGGNLFNGAAFDYSQDDIFAGETEASLPQQIIFFGRELPDGAAIDLDTVYFLNGRFNNATETDVGPIQLIAHTVSGRIQALALAAGGDTGDPAINSPALTLPLNGEYEMHGLPTGEPLFIFIGPQEFSWDGVSEDYTDAQFTGFPYEFFGGVEAPLPRFGQGVIDEDDGFLNTIGNSFAYIGLDGALVDLNADGFNDEFRATGAFTAAVIDGPRYLSAPARNYAVMRLELADGRVLDFDNRSGGFGGNYGVLTIDDTFDTIKIRFDIEDRLGNLIGVLTQNIDLVSYPTISGAERRGFEVSWEFENRLDEPIGFGIAQLYDSTVGLLPAQDSTSIARTNPELYVNGERMTHSTLFTGADVPMSVDWYDNAQGPQIQFSIFGDLPGLTTPDEILTVDTDRARLRTNSLWTMQPGQSLEAIPGFAQFAVDTGFISRWLPRTVAAGDTATIVNGGTYIMDPGIADPRIIDLRDRENGLPKNDPAEIMADDASIAYPITLGAGDFLAPVDIITNTGTRQRVAGDDYDLDGVVNDIDNCPYTPNADQADEDQDGIGDVCEGDIDGDGVNDALDNCPYVPNEEQSDIDGDLIGDVCDDDIDGDGIEDSLDNCPYYYNPDQTDLDGDGVGDICEQDIDGDGIPNENDNCPTTPNPSQSDIDADGTGDACDTDRDGDGIDNVEDNCPDAINEDQADSDGDGIGDVCETQRSVLRDTSPASVVTEDAQIPEEDLFVEGASAGDLNGDGYPDLVLAVSALGENPGAGLANRIYINDARAGRPGFFVDSTFGADGILNSDDDRLPPDQRATSYPLLFDYDLDGDLDIYFCNLDGPNQLFLNVDINDKDINPFPDDDEFGDGFFQDVTDSALPGILNTKGSGLTRSIPDITTRSKAADVDGDGDLDIIVSNYDVGPDLDVTLQEDFAIDVGETAPVYHGPSGLVNSFVPFSERILINRRNDLIDPTTLRPVPRGTPDAFIAFQANPASWVEQVFPPNAPVGEQINVNGFWFRDETLGQDGLFLSEDGSPETFDRLPPLHMDLLEDTPVQTIMQEDNSMTMEVALGRFMNAGMGPDFSTADLILPPNSLNWTVDGDDKVYVNMDIDGDLIPDGYYGVMNYGIDTISLPRTGDPWAPIGAGYDLFGVIRIGTIDGTDDVYNGSNPPDNDDLNVRITSSMGIAAADISAQGYATFVTESDQSAGSPTNFRMRYFQDAPYYAGPGRSQNNGNSIGGSTSGMFNDSDMWAINGPLLTISAPVSTFAQDFQPYGSDHRYRSVTTSDIDRNGAPDVLSAADASSTAYYVETDERGRSDVYFNLDSFGVFATGTDAAGSWLRGGLSAMRPNPPLEGAHVCVLDADLDGDDDVFVSVAGGQSRLYINGIYSTERPPEPFSANDSPMYFDRTREFTEDMLSTGIARPGYTGTGGAGATNAVISGDIDRDGDIDVAVLNGGSYTDTGDYSLVLSNRGKAPIAGTATLTPANTAYPAGRTISPGFGELTPFLDLTARPTTDGKFIDFDNDGDLDLFIANYGIRNRLYANRDADASDLFEDDAVLSGITFNPEWVNSLTAYDLDPRDSTFDPAIVAAEGLGDGILEDQTARIPELAQDQHEFAWAVADGDFDNDGMIDLFLANAVADFGVPNVLMRNDTDGSGKFVDESSLRLPKVPLLGTSADGIRNDDSRDAAFLDVDGDGDQDIIVANRQVSSLTGTSVNPNFAESCQLLINQGGAQGGALGHFLAASTDQFPSLEIAGEAVAVANFDPLEGSTNRADWSDVTEDLDGNGIVTDTEILNFNNFLQALEERRDELFGGAEVPVADIVQGVDFSYVRPVTVLQRDPNDIHTTVLTNRAPRYVDMNGNGQVDLSLDIVIATSSGIDVYLANDGSGNYTDMSEFIFPDPAFNPHTSVVAGDIDMDGYMDLIFAASLSRGEEDAPVDVAVSRSFESYRVFEIVTNEVPLALTVQFQAGTQQSTGNARGVDLLDIDGDGDLDLYVGELGRTFGVGAFGSLNPVYENRMVGSGFNAPRSVGYVRAPEDLLPDQTVQTNLSVAMVSPSFVHVGERKTIRVLGTGFKEGALVTFGDGVDLLANPIIRTSQIIDVDVRGREDAVPGPRYVRVMNISGETATTADYAFSVLPAAEGGESETTPPSTDHTGLGSQWMLYEN
ncbi:thrombospondin type 3 repeat-containing protein [bacterium]|nr:thrombospondin type 3 repeat-containing protein [bacterium]